MDVLRIMRLLLRIYICTTNTKRAKYENLPFCKKITHVFIVVFQNYTVKIQKLEKTYPNVFSKNGQIPLFIKKIHQNE